MVFLFGLENIKEIRECKEMKKKILGFLRLWVLDSWICGWRKDCEEKRERREKKDGI